MRNSNCLAALMISILFLGTSCTTYHFGIADRAGMVPDDFGQTEAVLARAEQSPGAKYCSDKITQAKKLATDGAITYWSCNNTESSRLLEEARKLAEEAEKCGPQGATTATTVKVCMPLKINFEINRTDILPEYDLDIGGVANFMKENPTTTAIINGYTDNIGGEAHNLVLSQKRAENVVNRLVDKFGIKRSRLSAKGYGMSQPIADNSTVEGRQQNRRIEAVIDCVLDKNFVPPPVKVCIPLTIDFDTDSALIKPEFESQIAKAADFMKEYPETTALVAGHTDAVGIPSHNMKLSQRRAESVMHHLVSKYGIDASRLSAKGYGDTRRIDYNTTADGRKKNRRVEVWVDCVLIKK